MIKKKSKNIFGAKFIIYFLDINGHYLKISENIYVRRMHSSTQTCPIDCNKIIHFTTHFPFSSSQSSKDWQEEYHYYGDRNIVVMGTSNRCRNLWNYFERTWWWKTKGWWKRFFFCVEQRKELAYDNKVSNDRSTQS